jgi:hypothetical protein
MPYKILKNADNSYKLINSETGRVHAKGTTLKKAEAQMRLLSMIEGKKKDKK